MTIETLASRAAEASIELASMPSAEKNHSLACIRNALQEKAEAIIQENQLDLQKASQENLPLPLLKRLKFDQSKIQEVCKGIDSLIALPDPVGTTLSATELDKGLELYKVTCPIGVIGVIFESRPDALVQISTLCLKSGNAVLLKGGSEAARTNRILAEVIYKASLEAGLPAGWLALLETRQDAAAMLALDDYIDLIIPRGSNEFVRHILNHTTIPVLGHANGICHVYVDKDADLEMAVRITVDSKCQYPAVCNAAETLLVHSEIAQRFLPLARKALEEQKVQLRGCEKTRQYIPIAPASEEDWKSEYLDLILSIRVVDTLQEAVRHINTYGSGHTDAIVTANRKAALYFLDHVDSADVFWNCSTRFSDGYRYGLGAEVGISTGKIHARGPVGLDGLLIYKWRLLGRGHIVAEYAAGQKQFAHRPLSKRWNPA